MGGVVSFVNDAVSTFAGGVKDAMPPADVVKAAAIIGGAGYGMTTLGTSMGLGATGSSAGAGVGAGSGAASLGGSGFGAAGGSTGMAGFTAEQLAGPVLTGGVGAGQGLSAATLGSAAGGGSFLSNLGTNIASNPLGALQTAQSLYGAVANPSPGSQGQQAQNMVDPFAPYRPQYAQQLNQLMSNPASVQNLPGYQAELAQGTQAVERTLAQHGQIGSGQEMMSLRDYASGQQNKYFQQQLGNLSILSGAGQSPANGGAAGLQTQQGASNTQSQNISAGIQGLISMFGNTPTAANTAINY